MFCFSHRVCDHVLSLEGFALWGYLEIEVQVFYDLEFFSTQYHTGKGEHLLHSSQWAICVEGHHLPFPFQLDWLAPLGGMGVEGYTSWRVTTFLQLSSPYNERRELQFLGGWLCWPPFSLKPSFQLNGFDGICNGCHPWLHILDLDLSVADW